ncbi:tripartite tricarboxylate transporter TctB family protein [Reinekea marina]|nr:tripartite tricarboxylate transporter TctB family protein [Reinekea marina]MDN3648441.1 tripartite tricarboxylate transporter TctB family protein [Reinekea marina]
MLNGDRLLGLFLFVIALAYGWASQQWPEPFGSHEVVGPDTFPMILAVVLALASIALMFKPEPNNKWPHGKTLLEIVYAVLALVLYAVLMEPLGFILSTMGAVTFLSWRMGGNLKIAAIIALASAVGVFLLFNNLLDLPLPLGLLEMS